MIRGKLRVEMLHFWHCSSGEAGEGDVDLVPRVESCGLPEIPGKTLRGRLKRSGWEAGISDDTLDKLFGTGSRSVGQFRPANARLTSDFADYCRAYFAAKSAHAPEVAGLFQTVNSTAMENGVAAAHTLRRVLYAIPCVLEADFEFDGSSTEFEKFKECVSELRALGKGKRDGYGWCKAEIPSYEEVSDGAKSDITEPFTVELELQDDIVLSATAATTGGHTTLDYVPGANLFGAVAADLFKLGEKTAAEAVAAGRIQFSNAYPVNGTDESVPLPLAWFGQKGIAPIVDNVIQPERVQNLAVTGYTGGQPVQLRAGYFSPTTGRVYSPAQSHQLRTAVSNEPDYFETAAPSQLFGFQSLKAGLKLRATVTGDANLLKIARARFDGKTIRLGRSKFAEYGRASCTVLPAELFAMEFSVPEGKEFITIFARSDLLLVDKEGLPAIKPEPHFFGLAGWELVESRTYLRFRRYSPWNGKRGGPDLERQMIAKGSVMTFKRSTAAGDAKVPAWVGMGRTEGFGQVLVEPDFLVADRPSFNASAASVVSDGPKRPLNDEIFAFAVERMLEQRFDTMASEIARNWVGQWAKKDSVSASQWSRLADEARNAESLAKLKEGLGDATPDKDKPGRSTFFGHGRAAKKWTDDNNGRDKSLASFVLASLGNPTSAQEALKKNHALDPAELCESLMLASFENACKRMAAKSRRNKEGAA